MRAKRLRYETKNWAIHAKADENQITFHTIRRVYLMRPWVMIVQEPILACLTAYMSYIYGVLYLLFEAVSHAALEMGCGWTKGYSVPDIIPRRSRMVAWHCIASIHILHVSHEQ